MSSKERKRMTNYKVKKPVVSVYMPVFNAATYLPEAIESILSQSFTQFEFIIIDDASTDKSWKVIQKYARLDKRIRAFRNKLNLGVSLSSNIAISMARGKFLARMDADDISSLDRLEKQVKFFSQNQQSILLGGQCAIINESNQIIGFKSFPLSPHKVLIDMLFWAVPVQQGFMMINLKKLPKNFSWYQANQSSAEEIDLFFKLGKYGEFANLPENLYFYRQLPNSLSHRNPKSTFFLTLQSRFIALKNGYRPSLLAIIINLAQIIAVLVLPNRFIYSLWYFVRGVNHFKSNLSLTLAKIGVKS